MIPALQQDEPSFARMVRGRHPVRRQRIIALSLTFQQRVEAHKRQMDLAAEAIRRARQVYPEPPANHPAMLIEAVAAWHGVGVADIMGQSRAYNIVAARQDAIVAVYMNCRIAGERYSLTALGRVFKRDHTTIMHALRKRGVL